MAGLHNFRSFPSPLIFKPRQCSGLMVVTHHTQSTCNLTKGSATDHHVSRRAQNADTLLTGLCSRRNWPDPYYQAARTQSGSWRCVVRVNNREYQTAKSYLSESLAREGAAITAYTICRDFSANDGMYPAGFAHNGVLQGNPVPVGSGRHQRRQEGGLSQVPSTATAVKVIAAEAEVAEAVQTTCESHD